MFLTFDVIRVKISLLTSNKNNIFYILLLPINKLIGAGKCWNVPAGKSDCVAIIDNLNLNGNVKRACCPAAVRR